MNERKEEWNLGPALDWLGRHWIAATILTWLLFCGWFYLNRQWGIQWFALGDTDDNLRMAQVRALLAGQDWYDLRQYRFNPPYGADIHWSRLVDLPLAGLILGLRPFVGGAEAERWAVAIAPLLPHVLMLFGLALTVRRLVDPRAFWLAFLALFYAGSTNGMFMPLRIDHHGWQLALLMLGISGLVDPKRARGGATLGIATAGSLSIGLEMLIYLALAGTATVLFWVIDAAERRRLAAYAGALSGGTALGFLLFASYANRQAVCDALSPVWLSDALLGGALLFGLALLSPGDWKRRLLLAAGAGMLVAAFHALAWPHCLTRLEGISDEANRLWLSHVREARPLYRHGWRTATLTLALPLTGLVGWGLLAWRNRADRMLLARTLGVTAPAIVAIALLMWQTRTGPAAQMFGAAGAAALVWIVGRWAVQSANMLVRTIGLAVVAVVGLGGAVPLAMGYVAPKKQTARDRAVGKASRLCPTLAALRPVARQPRGMVFTILDLAPRLIAVTHHSTLIGPYHRNDELIVDAENAFRGSAEQARAILAKYDSDYLLTCPNGPASTIFMSETPNGFYAQLEAGKIPAWLTPVELPKDSPFRMWRVTR